MSVYNNHDKMRKCFELSVKDMRKDEVSLWWAWREMDIGAMSTSIMKQQMKIWSNQMENGKIQVRLCNNKTLEYKNKKYYTLVVQPTNKDELRLDPLLLSLGMMVDGYGMIFLSEKNRDTTYEYLLKHKKKVKCDGCQKQSSENMKLCSGCERVRYCDAECQKKHWKEHKKVCVKCAVDEVD